MNTATPTCASSMPYQLPVWVRRRGIHSASGWPLTRSNKVSAEVVTIHSARNRPKPTSGLKLPSMKGNTSATIRLTAAAQRSCTASSGSEAFFQRAIGPTPIRNIAGTISGTKTALK